MVLFVLLSCSTTVAQSASVPARVNQPVDDENLITLRGNTHPLARPEYDRGLAPDSLPMERMLLVLQRSPEQEAALRQRLDQQQVKSSPYYHQWLTPEEFGRQFGPADADIQAVTDWLIRQGFEVKRVAAGRTVIEFSGTAFEVRQALHTEIHKFAVNGEEHWANASDPRIPAALVPVVAGVASLNNFSKKPLTRRLGPFRRWKTTGEVKPLFTYTSSGVTTYAVGPGDFATIYNLGPLYQAGTDGSGQSVAIVAESNINIQDVRDFRSLFGLPANDPQIILDGPDPGILTGVETEADVDVEWAGATARNATIKLVVSESTEISQGVDLSALYIIDNNIAPVLSESFGTCELFAGVAGNAFLNNLWEQGAAEGITIAIAAGDNGSAGCDGGTEPAATFGLAVSALASPPFAVGIGGTDFDDSSSISTYWSTTNNSPTETSAKSYIPEVVWSDSCARSGVNGCTSPAIDGSDLIGGGGGPSNCGVLKGTDPNATCVKGYAKPSWQTGPGVPNDGVRDTPDISLFAGNGAHSSVYVICEADNNPNPASSCDLNAPFLDFLGVGGTSVPTPAFAGIMALVNQKTGERQGNANYVLYKLAAQNGASCTSNAAAVTNSSCIFYDVVNGNNSVICQGGTPNCSNSKTNGFGILVNPSQTSSPAWTTGPGYDLATGLGSINAANLVKNWTSVSFTPTTTTLTSLSPTTLTHGQPVDVTIHVTSASGTPTGAVALTGGPNNSALGIADFILSAGAASGVTNLLPGGTYSVTAHYGGDGTFGASSSSPPIQVTVNKESSETKAGLVTFDFFTGNVTSLDATTAPYGSPYVLRVDVTNSAGQECSANPVPCPTGQVTLTDNGKPLDLGTFTLNSQGNLEDQPIQLSTASHTVTASYAGDNSFQPSASPAVAISITKAATTMSLTPSASPVTFGTSVTLTALVNTESSGVAPTGTVQFLNGSTPLNGNVTYTPAAGSSGFTAQLQATLAASLSATATITAKYSGDSNYVASTSTPATVTVSPGLALAASPASLTIAAPGQSGTSVLTVTSGGGFSGTVTFSCKMPSTLQGAACSFSPASLANSGNTTLTVTTTAAATAPLSLPGLPGGGIAVCAVALLLALAVKKRRLNLAFALLFVALVAASFGGCGGGGGSSTVTPPVTSTSAGTYMLTVTATSGTLSSSTPVTLTVQ